MMGRGISGGLHENATPDGYSVMHVWCDESLLRRRARAHDSVRRRPRRDDASANAWGEAKPGVAFPGDPDDVPLYRGPGDEDDPPRAAGGVNPEPAFIDARSIRISAKDQNGKLWAMRAYGPNPQTGGWAPAERDILGQLDETEIPPPIPLTSSPRDHLHTSDLGRLQRSLDRHYRRE